MIVCIVSHDEVAEILGVHAKSFEETYADKTMGLKRLFMEHVKTLCTPTSRTGASAGAGAKTLSIQVDPCRFPIAPVPTSWDKVNKEHMESLYRTYMTQHYRKYQCLITVPACLSIYRACIEGQRAPSTVSSNCRQTKGFHQIEIYTPWC